MKKALISGITGQDGSYLAEFLLGKGYCHGGRFCRIDRMGHQQTERATSTVPGCQPGQRTLWLSGKARASGRTQENDAVVFCQPQCAARGPLLADHRKSPPASPPTSNFSLNLPAKPAGANLNAPAQACAVFSSLTPAGKGPKTLKHNEFGNHLEWSKTCEFFATYLYIPQETRP